MVSQLSSPLTRRDTTVATVFRQLNETVATRIQQLNQQLGRFLRQSRQFRARNVYWGAGFALTAVSGVDFGFMSQGKLSLLSQLSQHLAFLRLLSCDSPYQLSQSVARGAKVWKMEGAR